MPETQSPSPPPVGSPAGLGQRFVQEFRSRARGHLLAYLLVMAALVMFPAYRAVKAAMAGEGGSSADAGFVQGQLPTCDAIVGKSLLKQAVEANTSPILGTIKVHRIGDVIDYMAFAAAINAASGSEPARQTTPPDENMLRVRAALENRRMCGARLFTSRGQHLWNYTVVWTSAAKDEIFVQAEFGE